MKIVNVTLVGAKVNSLCVEDNETIRGAFALAGLGIEDTNKVFVSGTDVAIDADGIVKDSATYILSKKWKGNQDIVTVFRVGGATETVCVEHGSTVANVLALVHDEVTLQTAASETGSFQFQGDSTVYGILKDAATTTIPQGQGTVRIIVGKNWKGNE